MTIIQTASDREEIALYALAIFVTVIIFTFLQSLFAFYIKIGSVMPDFLLVLVLCFALTERKIKTVIAVSVLCGIFADCISGRIFGNYIAKYVLAAVIIYQLNDSIFKNGFIADIVFVFLMCVLGETVFYLINISALKDIGYIYALFGTILPSAVYNTVCASVILPVTRKICKKRTAIYR